MSDFDADEDEDWYDEEDDDELDEEEASPCPECGGPVQIVTDKCPACGYWLTEADRRVMWQGMSQPQGLKLAAKVLLVLLLVFLLLGGYLLL